MLSAVGGGRAQAFMEREDRIFNAFQFVRFDCICEELDSCSGTVRSDRFNLGRNGALPPVSFGFSHDSPSMRTEDGFYCGNRQGDKLQDGSDVWMELRDEISQD